MPEISNPKLTNILPNLRSSAFRTPPVRPTIVDALLLLRTRKTSDNQIRTIEITDGGTTSPELQIGHVNSTSQLSSQSLMSFSLSMIFYELCSTLSLKLDYYSSANSLLLLCRLQIAFVFPALYPT